MPLRSIHSAYWDHPRICGEHLRGLHACMSEQGSSPHMRGTLGVQTHESRRIGIIPAYAGNTCVCRGKTVPNRDHPRICGEHFGEIVKLFPELGSSPHMRGTRNIKARTCLRVGIIPAYAGNTSSAMKLLSEVKDHPRICGEHPSASSQPDSTTGSSPHMRGTLALV